jgi:hypothetical protein
MTAPAVLRVRLDGGDSATAAAQRVVLASVPGRFVVTGTGPADVTVVSGRDPRWPDTVARAVDAGARGVLVAAPGLAAPDEVRDLARAVAGRAVVAVDTAYATDRTWTSAAADVATDAATAAIVDSVVTVPDGDVAVDAFLDQLAVVRPLLGRVGDLRLVHRTDRAYVVTAPRITLAGVTSAAGRAGLALDVVSVARRWQIRWDGTDLAGPTGVTVHDATGTRTRPLVYESGRRVTWHRLHRAITGDGTVAYPLDVLADDLRVARDLMG